MNANKNNTATVAGITGAIIGAGVTAAAVALSDKETRKKVTAKIVDVKKKAEHMMHDAGNKAEVLQDDAKKILADEKKMAEDMTKKEPQAM